MKLPSADQQDFADTVLSLLDKRDPLASMRHAIGPRQFDHALWNDLLELGLLEPAATNDVLTSCLVAVSLGQKAAPLPYLSAVVGNALVAAGGGNPDGMTTYGMLGVDGRWTVSAEYADGRVTGTLPFVPDADIANSVVVSIDDSGTLALVDLSGASVITLDCLDGTQPLARVELRNTPAEVLPAAADVAGTRHLAVALHCAALLGAMTWLLNTTVEYAGQRVQFGLPIAARQAVKHRCASMLIAAESSRSLVLELADAIESGSPGTPLIAATAMAWVSDAAEEIAGGALQLHGGIGFTWEHDLHHYFKRCTAGSLLLGSAAYHRGLVAELLTATRNPSA